MSSKDLDSYNLLLKVAIALKEVGSSVESGNLFQAQIKIDIMVTKSMAIFVP